MIHRTIYWSLPACILLGQGACSNGKSNSAEGARDTTVGTRSSSTSVQPTDTNRTLASGHDSSETKVGTGAADVVRRYYDAIQHCLYDSAYVLWDRAGAASRQTRAEFARGFQHTDQTIATIADNIRVEGAAGSQYATVPVTVDAVLRSGARQHFVGTYVLRRSMVDGATPRQRTWHIYSAHLQQR